MSRSDLRNALLCLVITTAAFLATGPVAEMGLEDDWSYAFTARQCALSGRLIYNGWATAVIVPHTYWGALFIRLFGFSFTVLRFSTLPMAGGSVALCYLLARQADLRPAAAFFTAMLLAFSPLFLPLATSFMVDVPGLFFMLASLCALIAAAHSSRWMWWLCLGASAGMIGGMSRQIGWTVPLALLPYLAIVRRGDRRFLAGALCTWLVVIVDVVLTMRWFSRQPLSVADMGYAQAIDAVHNPIRTLLRFLPWALTTMMLILPAAAPALFVAGADLWRGRARRAGAMAGVVCAAMAIFLLLHPSLGLEPWLANTVTTQGVMGGLELSGHRPIAQPLLVRGVVSAAVLASVALLASQAAASARAPRRRRWRSFWFPPDGRIATQALLLFTAAYLALLIPRADQNWLSDRYALPLIPVLAIFLLRRWPPNRPAPAVSAAIVLALYGLYALASTQDVLALARARGKAVQKLAAAGIAPTAIAAGIEYDCWAQLLATGYINDYRLPRALFKPDVGMTPSLRPVYRVEFEPQVDTRPSAFGTIDYFSALPPFHRRIYIDKFIRPWWADPQQVRNTPYPPPTGYESYFSD
jgi:hypothetical protein